MAARVTAVDEPEEIGRTTEGDVTEDERLAATPLKVPVKVRLFSETVSGKPKDKTPDAFEKIGALLVGNAVGSVST